MTFAEIAAEIAANTVYRGRVEYALYLAAMAVMSEAADAPNHAVRCAFSCKVLGGYADIRAAVVASLTAPALSASANANAIADADIQLAIESSFDCLAGVVK